MQERGSDLRQVSIVHSCSWRG